jgi:glycosyltransferase involved in cell wall biosynthesis
MAQPARGRLVVGLARHRGTESRSSGASPGTLLLFSTLEESLRERCQLQLLPAYYYGAPARLAVSMAEELLGAVDALILSVPPHPAHLEALALVRRDLGRRVPFVYLPLGEFPRGAVSYRHLYQYLEPQDVVAFSSTADRAVHDGLVARTPARTCVVPFGIDLAPYRTAAAFRANTRHRLGLTEDDVVLVVHGRSDPGKNVHGAAAVFGELLRRVPGCRLWIVGEFPERGPGIPSPQPLSSLGPGPRRDLLVESLAGSDAAAVSCWGEVPRALLPEVLTAADVAVNLTVNPDENFGFGVVEAMAAGLPVVGTDWGGLRDTIDHGVVGYRVDTIMTSAGVAVDMWAAVRHTVALARDPLLRKRLGAAGAARAERCYRLDQFADALVDVVSGTVYALVVPAPVPHHWTTLGRRLAEHYSLPLSGVRSGGFPVPFPPDLTPADAALQHEVARPYATRGQDLEPQPGATYVLASPLMRHKAGHLSGIDPLQPVSRCLLDRSEDDVCRRLIAGPAGYEDLIVQDGGAALRRMLTAGLVVRSEMSLEPREEEAHVGPRPRG